LLIRFLLSCTVEGINHGVVLFFSQFVLVLLMYLGREVLPCFRRFQWRCQPNSKQRNITCEPFMLSTVQPVQYSLPTIHPVASLFAACLAVVLMGICRNGFVRKASGKAVESRLRWQYAIIKYIDPHHLFQFST